MSKPESLASLHIVGQGRLGSDLGKIAPENGFVLEADANQADIVAFCTPSHVSDTILEEGTYNGKTVIDLSGSAKQRGEGQYGLMRTENEPWDPDFNARADLYTNPGCTAAAVIKGLGAAGITGEFLPESLHVFSVGGQTYGPSAGKDEIRLARRLHTHPHVAEIEGAFDHRLKVASFMPVISDVPHGLLVGIHGKTLDPSRTRKGSEQLVVSDVLGTDELRYRLEHEHSDGVEDGLNFSLGVAIDNLRFVTKNAVELMRFIVRAS